MNSNKKTNMAYTPEDLSFALNVYKEKVHDEIIAVNVYVFLVGCGCVETNPALGSLTVNHNLLVVKQYQDQIMQGQSFLTSK
jgi:hypothetical protein